MGGDMDYELVDLIDIKELKKYVGVYVLYLSKM